MSPFLAGVQSMLQNCSNHTFFCEENDLLSQRLDFQNFGLRKLHQHISISKCFQMSPEIFKCLISISKCLQMSPNVFELNLSQCLQIFSKCFHMSLNVFKCLQIFPNVFKSDSGCSSLAVFLALALILARFATGL